MKHEPRLNDFWNTFWRHCDGFIIVKGSSFFRGFFSFFFGVFNVNWCYRRPVGHGPRLHDFWNTLGLWNVFGCWFSSKNGTVEHRRPFFVIKGSWKGRSGTSSSLFAFFVIDIDGIGQGLESNPRSSPWWTWWTVDFIFHRKNKQANKQTKETEQFWMELWRTRWFWNGLCSLFFCRFFLTVFQRRRRWLYHRCDGRGTSTDGADGTDSWNQWHPKRIRLAYHDAPGASSFFLCVFFSILFFGRISLL